MRFTQGRGLQARTLPPGRVRGGSSLGGGCPLWGPLWMRGGMRSRPGLARHRRFLMVSPTPLRPPIGGRGGGIGAHDLVIPPFGFGFGFRVPHPALLCSALLCTTLAWGWLLCSAPHVAWGGGITPLSGVRPYGSPTHTSRGWGHRSPGRTPLSGVRPYGPRAGGGEPSWRRAPASCRYYGPVESSPLASLRLLALAAGGRI